MSSLIISNTSIRQDSDNRYCLNDLHKASGLDPKNKPSNFLANQQTKDLVLEIEKDDAGIPASKKIIGKGKSQGTYAVKELVYAYAMWISPSFSLKVIRAYDSLVNTPPIPQEKKTLQSKPGCLTTDQQDVIKNIVRSTAESLPKNQRAKMTIRMWSAIKKKYGRTYKEVDEAEFNNIVSLLARLPLEGELLQSPKNGLVINKDTEYGQRFLIRVCGNETETIPVPQDAFVLTPEQAQKNINEILPGYRVVPESVYHSMIELKTQVEKL